MARQKNYSKLIILYGCVVFGAGLCGAIFDSMSGHPFNFGVILGWGAHMIIGLFAVLIGNCLKKIEERLDEIG
jgi:hypothetical protein